MPRSCSLRLPRRSSFRDPSRRAQLRLGAVSEARCPTFSWSGVAGARGYRLAVFRVAELAGDEPALVASAQVDGDAHSFPPALGQCLERGHRYAWTVAALAGDPSSSDATGDDLSDLSWAPALVFEVEGDGLGAEEVAEVFPELVIYDQNGKPQTVKYHLLGSLLLRALQEQQEELASRRAVADSQRSELARLREGHRALTDRLAALESRSRR